MRLVYFLLRLLFLPVILVGIPLAAFIQTLLLIPDLLNPRLKGSLSCDVQFGAEEEEK